MAAKLLSTACIYNLSPSQRQVFISLGAVLAQLYCLPVVVSLLYNTGYRCHVCWFPASSTLLNAKLGRGTDWPLQGLCWGGVSLPLVGTEPRTDGQAWQWDHIPVLLLINTNWNLRKHNQSGGSMGRAGAMEVLQQPREFSRSFMPTWSSLVLTSLPFPSFASGLPGLHALGCNPCFFLLVRKHLVNTNFQLAFPWYPWYPWQLLSWWARFDCLKDVWFSWMALCPTAGLENPNLPLPLSPQSWHRTQLTGGTRFGGRLT